MTQPPDDLTQPIASGPTAEQAAVPAADAGVPAPDAGSAPAAEAAVPAPDWARAGTAGEAPASDWPAVTAAAPAAGYGVPVAPASGYGVPVAPKASWRSRMSGGKGLAVGALVVGLGLGAVGGSVVTWAAVHDGHGVGTTADGRGFDRDGDRGFGPPDGGRGGFGPGDGQRQDGGQQQGGNQQGGPGQLPGGGTGGSTGSGTGANGTALAT